MISLVYDIDPAATSRPARVLLSVIPWSSNTPSSAWLTITVLCLLPDQSIYAAA